MITKPYWFAEFLYWGFPTISAHSSYEAAVKASTVNPQPFKKFIRISGPHYYEVPA